MPRPFRFQPPTPTTAVLERPRLAAMFEQRWARRAVLVVAGPGFGKSLLLAAAMQGQERSRRTVWLACEPDDDDADHLTAGLVEAFGLRTESGLDTVLDAVWAMTPTEVCVLLDDVHEIAPGSGGAHVIDRLLDDLSGNGHLVLASRDAVPARVARLAASGQLVRIGESELLFDADELARFAAVRGIDPGLLGSTGGWPAIAELVSATASDLVSEYLWDEVVSQLGPQRARWLAQLAAVGGGDDDVASAIVGHRVEIDAIVRSVPLVERSVDGWAAPHPLWQPTLLKLLTNDDAALAQRRVADVHRSAGRIRFAAQLLIDAGAWRELLALMLEAAHHVPETVARGTGVAGESVLTASDFGRWCRSLPAHLRGEPEALLAAGLELMGRDPGVAVGSIERAGRRFRDRGDVVGELFAINLEGVICWWLNDLTRLAELHQRVGELTATGEPLARVLNAIGEAAIAHLLGDADTVLGCLAGIGADAGRWRNNVRWLRAVAHRRLGELDASLAELDLAAAEHTEPDPQVDIARLRARWLLGDVDEVVRGFESASAGYPRGSDAFLWRECALELAARRAWLGDAASADALLAEAAVVFGGDDNALTTTLRTIARGASALARGDEELAGELLRVGRDDQARFGFDAEWYWVDRAALALVYVLCPDEREHLRTSVLSACHRHGIQLAEALVGMRAGDDGPLRSLEWPTTGEVRAHLPLRWTVELIVAAHVVNNPPPSSLLTDLGPGAASILRELVSTAQGRTKSIATGLMRSIPVPPAYRIGIEVIGPLRLTRDGVSVDTPDLRRTRVRELLSLLVARRRIRRDEAGDLLWTDAADAANNLNVTLHYLQRLLQPERRRSEPPYFVRVTGDWLVLTDDEGLSVDAWKLDAWLDGADAADNDSSVTVALERYRTALELWRGEPYADVPYSEWAIVERERIRRRYTTAALRLAELQLAVGEFPAAIEAANRALDADDHLEPAHRLVVRAHLAAGDRAAARSALGRCADMLASLNVQPDPATSRLAAALDATASHTPRHV